MLQHTKHGGATAPRTRVLQGSSWFFHVLIPGFSSQVYVMCSQLVVSNQVLSQLRVVMLLLLFLQSQTGASTSATAAATTYDTRFASGSVLHKFATSTITAQSILRYFFPGLRSNGQVSSDTSNAQEVHFNLRRLQWSCQVVLNIRASSIDLLWRASPAYQTSEGKNKAIFLVNLQQHHIIIETNHLSSMSCVKHDPPKSNQHMPGSKTE